MNSLKTRLYACVLGAGLGLTGLSAAQASTVVNWTGDDSFNSSDTISFTGFTSSQLTSITGTGTFEAAVNRNNDPVTTTFNLFLDLNSVWTDVLTWTSTNKSEQLLSGLSTPINFASSTVTGIRLTSAPSGGEDDPNYDNFYHFQYCGHDCDPDIGEAFTFNSVAATPLPAALPMFAGGLGMLGLFGRRRKQKALNAIAA